MNNRVTRFVMILVVVAMYLNVGWAIGTYYHNYIFGHVPQTFWQTVWKGGYQYLTGGGNQLRSDQIIMMFSWPVLIGILVPISWAIYVIHHLAMLAYHFIVFILWLVGAGGIAKLLGVG